MGFGDLHHRDGVLQGMESLGDGESGVGGVGSSTGIGEGDDQAVGLREAPTTKRPRGRGPAGEGSLGDVE